ncbi:hypothetical protein AB4519_09455 [Vibrio splendidus]|nr:hypothetical protein [Vibrio splendidus]MCC5516656.1 hypothetical protein [Vibrio splendidus]
MTNASRNAITSFSIEMRNIQVGIAPWRELGMKDKMTGANALINNKVFR